MVDFGLNVVTWYHLLAFGVRCRTQCFDVCRRVFIDYVVCVGPALSSLGSHVVATQKSTLINNVASWPQLYAFGGDGMALTRCSRVL